jgi:hypothetical protein
MGSDGWNDDIDDDTDTELEDAKELADRVRENRCIQRLYGSTVNIEADFGDRQEWV